MYKSHSDIICFGEDWYSSSFGITKQIIHRLGQRGHRIFWINPLPYRMPSVRSKAFRQRFGYKLKSHLNPLRSCGGGQYVLCPFYVPYVGRRGVDDLNARLVQVQLGLLKMLFRISEPIYWATGYTVNNVLPHLGRDLLVFNWCDKYSAHRGISETVKAQLVRKDIEIVRRADLNLCSSHKIMEYISGLNETTGQVLHFPHGVDYEHFSRADAGPVPEDIRTIKHPIVGYFGTLGGGFNKDVIRYVAKSRPDWSIVLIGSLGVENEELRQFANVHILGPKPYQDIPYYGRCFDVGLMCWIPHEWADYCFPIKTLEYLALGLPVVSMPIEEITRFYSDVISIADRNEKWVDRIEWELRTDSEEKRRVRREKVCGSTWDRKVNQVLELINGIYQKR